jgi:hypothetical protein
MDFKLIVIIVLLVICVAMIIWAMILDENLYQRNRYIKTLEKENKILRERGNGCGYYFYRGPVSDSADRGRH